MFNSIVHRTHLVQFHRVVHTGLTSGDPDTLYNLVRFPTSSSSSSSSSPPSSLLPLVEIFHEHKPFLPLYI